jgi:hypothetical protein
MLGDTVPSRTVIVTLLGHDAKPKATDDAPAMVQLVNSYAVFGAATTVLVLQGALTALLKTTSGARTNMAKQ